MEASKEPTISNSKIPFCVFFLSHTIGLLLDEVKRVCEVACWCVQKDELERPTMGEVVQILEGLLELDIPLMPRLYFFILYRGTTSFGGTTCVLARGRAVGASDRLWPVPVQQQTPTRRRFMSLEAACHCRPPPGVPKCCPVKQLQAEDQV